jgi:shikimate kinase
VTFDDPRHVVLVGMMGAGKSTVGAQLADRLERPFVDLDGEIVRRSGRSIAELFADDGEAAFRTFEAATFADVIESETPLVIATGGGIVDGPARSMLTGVIAIWLTATVETLVERVGSGEGRPLLASGVTQSLTSLLEKRRDLYASVARITVAVDALTPHDVVDRVLVDLGAKC